MFTIGRSVLGTFLGVVVFFVLVISIEAAGHLVYPPPPDGFEQWSQTEKRVYMEQLPAGALYVVLGAWLVGTFAGGTIAALLARSYPLIHAGIIGAVCLIGSALTFRLIPHPEWFVTAAPLGIIVVTYAAGAVARANLPDSLAGEPVVGSDAGSAKTDAGSR